MEATAGLIAGSHNRNELVVIRCDGELSGKPSQQLSRQTCHICGDDVGLTLDGELFLGCNECAFPICRTCYEYERNEGSQVCPQCKTRFKRRKGCPRVPDDEEEDDVDDLENELNIIDNQLSLQHLAEGMLHNRVSNGRAGDIGLKPPGLIQDTFASQVPLLMNDHMSQFDDIPPEQHALVYAYVVNGGKSIHPLSSSDSGLPVQTRSLDPSKDLAAYGYGSVAWKERMENWKHRQEHLYKTKREKGCTDWEDGNEGPDILLMDNSRQPL